MQKVFNHPLRETINDSYRVDEEKIVQERLGQAQLSESQLARIENQSKELITMMRREEKKRSGVDSFMHEYDLSSDEGIALMCLAEAMLRIPDSATVDKLIEEKIGETPWDARLGQSESWTINAATWGLMLTGKVLKPIESENRFKYSLQQFAKRTSGPVIRKAVRQAMRVMGKQFVMGRTIAEALQRSLENQGLGYRYSYDMLGEAARTAKDAERYFNAYRDAIFEIGQSDQNSNEHTGPGISVKLSALHPRYEYTQSERAINEVVPKVLELAQLSKAQNINLTIDAEEADRLDLSLDIIERVFSDPSLADWEGFGIAVQSYQKRAWPLLDFLADLAKTVGRKMKVRLIKGAYWDSEIKLTQMNGFSGYPVFTRKDSTDVSFIACAKKLIEYQEYLYPQFATHNAYSVSVILELMAGKTDYEFQCLHGMGQSLYKEIVENQKIPCRIYAPVGSHEDLLPYLVRRLLENGANTSFVNRVSHENKDLSELTASPVKKLLGLTHKAHPKIPLPSLIYGRDRLNAIGIDLSDRTCAEKLEISVRDFRNQHYGKGEKSAYSPIDNEVIGSYPENQIEEVETIIERAQDAYVDWSQHSFEIRANCLNTIAKIYEENIELLIALLVNEAGKTYQDAIAEVREAVDFCRYYALRVSDDFQPVHFEGYTGETNVLDYRGRGVVVCISPWNFPLAIFTGQIVAALVTGNTVIAKPSEQTPLIALQAVKLMHAAGIPDDVLQLVIGSGRTVGDALVRHSAIGGVMFTGSTQTARIINQRLADSDGPIIPFIAETGGVNAMISDSSVLPEQLIVDVLRSAFGSAGQRCSALRVLFIQEEVADKIIAMLHGAMQELNVNDPRLLSTDLGPVIDQNSKDGIETYINTLSKSAKLIAKCELPKTLTGTFVAPHAFELDFDLPMPPEVFGPVLHVYRYRSSDLDKVIQKINDTQYGLTLGIQSRISETIDYVLNRTHAGNQYVNRDIIGAVVGLQPFGGDRLSGTGPKAGGPNYLRRLVTERTVTTNTTATGGNASLMSLEE